MVLTFCFRVVDIAVGFQFLSKHFSLFLSSVWHPGKREQARLAPRVSGDGAGSSLFLTGLIFRGLSSVLIYLGLLSDRIFNLDSGSV